MFYQLRRVEKVDKDSLFKISLAFVAALIIAIVFALIYELSNGSKISIAKFGFTFIMGTTWDPVKLVFGALPFIYGTLVTSLLALTIGLPISIGAAIFLSEKMKQDSKIASLLTSSIELLAAIPSVIYGLWGLFFLSPLIKKYVEEPLNYFFRYLPLFSGTPFGLDFFVAGIVLAIMIIPTVSSVAASALRAVPDHQREAVYSLGGTEWEVISKGVIPYAKTGIFAAIILGLARAVGETMAVTMVIGNAPIISASLFSPGYTLSSVIANEFTEATNPLYVSALIELGLILFVLALFINILARLILRRSIHRSIRGV